VKTSEEVFTVCRRLHLLYRWKSVTVASAV